MFIIEPESHQNATGALRVVYKKIEKMLGWVPPHFELFATLDSDAFQEYILYQQSLMQHPTIDAVLFPFIRLYIAQKEHRTYCMTFNTNLLRSQGIDAALLENIVENFVYLPVAKEQRMLAQAVLMALYDTPKFTRDHIVELEALGFSHHDFFDLLMYCSNFMSKSKIIEVYLKK